MPSLGEMPDEPLWYDRHDRNSCFRIIQRALWFNPNTSTDPADPLSGGGFHPFDSTVGGRVPTFYAASSLKAAISESPLLHDRSLGTQESLFSLSCRFAAGTPCARGELIDGFAFSGLSRPVSPE